MADRRKLAQGLMMMTPAMREDLAGREQDIQRGKTVELLRRAGKEMYENPIVNTAIGFTPGVGDVQAAGETFAALQRGAPWQETAGYAVGMLPFVPALRTTWHGSPHGFTKFDMSKIGTGEGAQAYGHGLYLADAPETAITYSNMRAAPNMEFHTASGKKLTGLEKSIADDITSNGLQIARINAKNNGPEWLDAFNRIKDESITRGYLYKVDLPDEQIAKMLDWDKPLSEQSETIQNALSQYSKNYENPEKALRDFLGTDYAKEFPNVRDVKWAKEILNNPDYDVAIDGKAWLDSQMRAGVGSSFYNLLGSKNAGQIYERMAQDLGGANLASQKLYEAGIPGIQYLDQASRGAGEGTRNYVVFSDEIPQILERNGQPIAQALREYKSQFPEGMLGKTEKFETGTPISFEYIRNTEKSPYMGEKFGQDIEPAGRYLSYKDPVVNMESMPNTWETGQVSFNNPLVVNFGESYGSPTNWKTMISESFGGKTGKDLSKAVANAGYDGIVTVDKYGTSEIVDLSKFIGKQK